MIKKNLDKGIRWDTMNNNMAKTAQIICRFTPKEAAHIRSIVKANGGTVSEFVRMCVNTGLAQQGDPAAYEMLTEMISKGIKKVVELKVNRAAMDAKRK